MKATDASVHQAKAAHVPDEGLGFLLKLILKSEGNIARLNRGFPKCVVLPVKLKWALKEVKRNGTFVEK